MIQDLSGLCCIKETYESMTRVDSLVPLMNYDPDRSWITDPDPDPDHPKRMHPQCIVNRITYSGLASYQGKKNSMSSQKVKNDSEFSPLQLHSR